MSTVTNGRRREWGVRDDLRANGYLVFRIAGSKGAADLIACKPGQTLFVQVKPNPRPIPPEDRARLLEWATYAAAVPLVAYKGPRGKGYTYMQLIDHGVRGGKWRPWTPDEAGAA